MLNLVVSLYDKIRGLTEGGNKKATINYVSKSTAFGVQKTTVKVVTVQPKRSLLNYITGLFIVNVQREDLVNTIDSVDINTVKNIEEQFQLSDQSTFITGKATSDVTNVFEVLQALTGKPLSDTTNYSDIVNLLTQKSLLDTSSLTDQQIVDIVKSITDQVNTTDDLDGAASLEDDEVMSFFKDSTDSTHVSDNTVIVVLFVRNFDDQFNLSDLYTSLVNKGLTNQTSFGEVLQKDNTKLTLDQYNVTDTYNPNFGKNPQDQTNYTEQNVLDILKSLNDELDVTDDLDGAATAEDEQTVTFFKSLSDTSSFNDLYDMVVNFFRTFTEEADFSDNYFLGYNKNYQDNLNLVETAVFDSTKPTSDDLNISDIFDSVTLYVRDFQNQSNISDSFSKVVAFSREFTEETDFNDSYYLELLKPYQDDFNLSEQATFNTSKPLSDQNSVNDVYIVDVDKTSTDSLTLSEQYVFDNVKDVTDQTNYQEQYLADLTKQLTDEVNTTDDLDGVATTEDEQVMTFFKSSTDQTYIQDTLDRIIEFTRDFTDLNNISESYQSDILKIISDTTSFIDIIDIIYNIGREPIDEVDFAEIYSSLFTTSRSDQFNISENYSPEFIKAPQDQTTLSDSLYLVSQGYADPTYFSGDYVGSSRIT